MSTEHDEHWRWAAPPVGVAGAEAGAGAPVLTARDRWKAALADRLPPTLRGRWGLDRKTGIVLAVSVLLGALLLGGWTVLRVRPHELAVPRGRPPGAESGAGGAGPRAWPEDSPDSGYSGMPPSIGVSSTDGLQGAGLPGAGVPGAGDGGGAGGASTIAGAPGAGPGVVVDVEGKVARPGVRTLPTGARILDALTAAGGALPGTDLTSLNQAQVLVDGEQVLVGVAAPSPADGGPLPKRGGKGRGRVGTGGAGGAEPVHLNSAGAEDLEQLPGIGPALAQRVIDYRTEHGLFRSVEELRQVSGFGGTRFQSIAPLLTL